MKESTSRLALAAAVAGMAVLIAACGGPSGESEPEVGGELHIYNWEDYFGETTIEDFEAEFGIEVFLETFADENEMWSVIAGDTSRYDLFFGASATVGEMAMERLVAELDHDSIPNLMNIYPDYLDLPGDPGNVYGVPYAWGTTGILYNKSCFEPEALSWSTLWDPRLSGRVAMDVDFSVILGSTLQSLGYPLVSSDPDHLDAAVLALQELRATNDVQFMAWDVMGEALSSGELCAGQVFNGDAVLIMEGSEQDLTFFVPQEGSDLYFDTMAIPRDAQNKAGAELFINFVLRPDVHASITDHTGYANPNMASVEQGYIDEESLADPVSYPNTDNLEPWVIFDSAHLAAWNEAWAEVANWSPVDVAR